MEKEFMSTVPDSVIAPKDASGEDHYYNVDDSIYNGVTIQDFITYLESDPDFYNEPTQNRLEMCFRNFLVSEMQTFRSNANWMFKNVLSVFLKDEIRKP